MHRDSCRHSCWDEGRDRRYCDGDRRRSRHRRDSDSSDSDDDSRVNVKCWTQNEKSEHSTTPETEPCTKNTDS